MISNHSSSRRRALSQLAAFGLAASSLPAWAAGPSTAPVFGIVPYLPSSRLFDLYRPLLPALSNSLGRNTEISAAADYRQHISLLRSGAYDIVADSLFISRIAQRELGHIPLLRTESKLEVIIVTANNSAIRSLGDLRGKTVSLTDRTAALGVIGLQYLRSRGLPADDAFRLLRSGSHLNSIEFMLRGHAVAAIVSKTTLAQIDPDTAKAVRVLATPPAGLASVIYHAHPRLASKASALREAMLAFAQSADGRKFLDALGHKGLVRVTDQEMKSLDPMVVEFYRQL